MQIVQLGAAEVDPDTNVPMAHVQLPLGDGEVSDYGNIPIMQCLGVTSLPAPATDAGAAEGVIDEELGGLNGTMVGGRDPRSADVAKGLGPGGTALHSTGADASKRSQVRCLEDMLAILIGNDTPIIIDRAAKRATVDLWGTRVEISQANGIVLCDETGTGMVSLKGGIVTISGTLSLAGGVSMGGAAAQPLAINTSLQVYLTALEVLLGTIAAATVPPTSAAVVAFTAAQVATKLTMGTLTTKGQ